jgi:hypothetical protein
LEKWFACVTTDFKNCDIALVRMLGIIITRFVTSIIQAKLKPIKKNMKENATRKRAVNVRKAEIKEHQMCSKKERITLN